jgi:hypothetical protein
VFKGCGYLQPRTSPPSERPDRALFLHFYWILATQELARLDRAKAKNIPLMCGGVFGSAWL